ncbi:hypothetical protein [Alteromonas sp. M12]|uniref:hypothetical protein n=1 Tax=Alteromonas sp. M12 TaxID=3135644 RepID=UPI00319E5FD8
MLGRNPTTTQKFAEYFNCIPCTDIHDLLALKPEFVAEAASPQSVVDCTVILGGGSHFIILSTAAFVDQDLYSRAIKRASDNNTKLYIAGGATGRFNLVIMLLQLGALLPFLTQKHPPLFLCNSF